MSKICVILNRSFSTSRSIFAKGAARIAITSKVPEPEPEKDTQILSKKCCGLNYMQGGEDPALKSDNEYPDWLWNLHIGKPRTYKDMDPNTREYWYALEKAQQELETRSKAGKGYYIPPRKNEISYVSRLQPRKAKTG